VAGLSAFLALVVGAVLWLTLRHDPYVAPTPTGPSTRIQPAPAATLLLELTAAVRRGDGNAAAKLAAVDDPAAQGALRAFAENAEDIALREVTLRYVDALGGVDSKGAWRAAATLQYRFSVDRVVATTEIEVGFAASGDSVTITTLGGDHGATPVWLASRIKVRRTPDTLVVAARGAPEYSRMADRAVRDVRQLVEDWEGPLVVEVVQGAAALDDALAADEGTFANIAGVTSPLPGAEGSAAAVHVFVNRESLAAADAVGRQVVLSHEAAHVALDAGFTGLPVWMAEGLADYIALRDVTLPLSVTAADITRQVRREGVPDSLPGDEAFDQGSEYFGAAYEAAWLACRLLAERVGERRLVRFYTEADRVSDFERDFERGFGLTVAQFTSLWQRALRGLAR
jgi:hypothetical protein